MQTFVCRQNIQRFRRLLEAATDDARYQEIKRFLEAEEAKLEALRKDPVKFASSQ